MLALHAYWGKKTLILGDVNSGKTQMTLELLALIRDRERRKVAVLDFAPEKTRDIGGKMAVPSDPFVFYYTTKIIPPRLTGRNSTEAEAYASQNAKAIDVLFVRYMKNPRSLLIINDVSLYLQMGDLRRLLDVLRPSHTVIINGYYGITLGDSALSKREREQMDRLAQACDQVIHL